MMKRFIRVTLDIEVPEGDVDMTEKNVGLWDFSELLGEEVTVVAVEEKTVG